LASKEEVTFTYSAFFDHLQLSRCEIKLCVQSVRLLEGFICGDAAVVIRKITGPLGYSRFMTVATSCRNASSRMITGTTN